MTREEQSPGIQESVQNAYQNALDLITKLRKLDEECFDGLKKNFPNLLHSIKFDLSARYVKTDNETKDTNLDIKKDLTNEETRS